MTDKAILVSVADCIARDTTTSEVLLYGKTNISSALTMSMTGTEVRGGYNNPLIYTFFHDKKIEIKITQANFGKEIIAFNAGALVQNEAITVVATDCLTTSISGSATCTNTPIGNVSVIMPNGAIQLITPVASVITVPGVSAATVITAIYNYTTTADQITVATVDPPSIVDLTLLCPVRNQAGVVIENLQINIPRFQVMGNYTMNFAANAANSQELDGTALTVESTDCTSGAYMAKYAFIPTSATTLAVTDIVASPTSLSFSAGVVASKQITTYGLRGGIYQNLDVTTSASYVKSSGGTFLTVGLHTGLVTSGSASTSGSGSIGITYYDATSGSLTDSVIVTVV